MNLITSFSGGLDLRTQRALQLMERFVERSGLGSRASGHRYLWTDAFAVCNFLELARATGSAKYVHLAGALVADVHLTLGKHRPDDWREGWLSGLSELGASAHPTWGGLRIGKPRPERRWDEPFDDHLEWERDGQYFHYLTRWMHALDQLARATRQPQYNLWARELASVAWAAFSLQTSPGSPRRLVWKMSIDLSRPLVPSTGHHDALDGYITCAQLQATATKLGTGSEGPPLQEERAGFEAMAEGSAWATTDPLGLGSLLSDAYRVAQLRREDTALDAELVPTLLSAALDGLAHFVQQNSLGRPAAARLAFRELGLAIGLHALERLTRLVLVGVRVHTTREEARLLEALGPALTLGSEIDAFWLKPEHREAASWAEHRDLNEVTLATSLCPRGYLELAALK
jgi:hypothetical protein